MKQCLTHSLIWTSNLLQDLCIPGYDIFSSQISCSEREITGWSEHCNAPIGLLSVQPLKAMTNTTLCIYLGNTMNLGMCAVKPMSAVYVHVAHLPEPSTWLWAQQHCAATHCSCPSKQPWKNMSKRLATGGMSVFVTHQSQPDSSLAREFTIPTCPLCSQASPRIKCSLLCLQQGINTGSLMQLKNVFIKMPQTVHDPNLLSTSTRNNLL